MGFSVLLLVGAISCASGNTWSGPVASTRFEGYISSVCESNWEDVKDKDACYGCLCSFSKLRQSPEAYDQMLRCGQTYLTVSPYDTCKDVIANDTDESTTNSSKPYCDFEKCIARVSMEGLVDECIKEASETGVMDKLSFTNVVTCILAKHRCRPDPNYPQYPGSQPRNNALYVKKDGQLEVTYTVYAEHLSSPCNTGPNGAIIYDPYPIMQASWPSAQCHTPETTTPATFA